MGVKSYDDVRPVPVGVRESVLQTSGALLRLLPPSRQKSRAGRLLSYALGDPPAVLGEVEGLSLYLRPADRTAGDPFWNGRYENGLVRLLVALLEPGTVFADIGANVGLIGLRVADEMRRAFMTGSASPGRVLLFEPVPGNLRLINASIGVTRLDEFATVFPIGLSDSPGDVVLELEGRDGRSGNAALSRSRQSRWSHTLVSVRMERLDEVLAANDLPDPTLIKLDVEGAEVGCLRGSSGLMARSTPVIYGEFHSGLMPEYGTTFLDVAALLGDLNYRIFAWSGPQSLREAKAEVGLGDVLLVPATRLARVRQLLAVAGIKLETA